MSVETTGNEECGDLVGGESNIGDDDSSVGNVEDGGVKPLNFLKEILEVVEWINKADGTPKNGEATQSQLAIKLEERFNTANSRIKELEGQLTEATQENDILKEKLDEMELLAGHHQTELVRLSCELEAEKWERFDAECRVKKMVQEVAELHVAVGELVGKLQVVEERATVVPVITAQTLGVPVIKQEVEEMEEQDEMLEERDQMGAEENEKRAAFRFMFLGLSSQVHDRLQKCEEAQVETKADISGIIKVLANMEKMISQRRRITGKVPTTNNCNAQGIFKFQRKLLQPPPPAIPSPMVQPSSKAVPLPIKSILMKRSADGTFVIRRNSQEQQQHATSSAKRKRVHFCLEDSKNVTVHTEYKENHRQYSHHNQNGHASSLPPDPLEDQFQPGQCDVDHFEIKIEGGLPNRFYCNCQRSFSFKKLLNRHLAAKQNGKIFNCPMCTKTFVLHESLKRHVQKSHRVQYHGGRYG